MIRILTVEDERAISNLIRMSLEKAGYSCTCAYDGAEAAELLEHSRYDLILLDIMLPEIDGFELMEYIAEDYIVKQFDTAELLARVDVVLRRYHKDQAVFEAGGLVIDTCSMHVKKDGI